MKKTMFKLTAAIAMLALFLIGCAKQSTPGASSKSQGTRASWTTISAGGFSSVATYTPTTNTSIGDTSKKALLIVLHGCTQSYTAYTTANLEDAADQYGMIVAAPDAMYKAGYSCWDYWGATKSRTSGDYKNLINLAKYYTDNGVVDPKQVYIAGLSSGGAFTMITACLAPDIFAGMGIMAGPSAGTSSNGAFSHESTASQTASRCEGYAGSYASHFDTQVTVSAAGTSDYTVPQTYAPQNAEAMAIIYGNTVAGSDASTSYGKEKLWTINGDVVISQLTLNGVAHAWPGGSGASGSYIDGSSINFGVYLGEFFKNNNRRIGESVPPEVDITSPADGAGPLTGTVTISATATDNVGVAKVEFFVNGTLKATKTSAPYSYNWDTTNLYKGNYTIVVKATDTSGNTDEETVAVVAGTQTDTIAPTGVAVTAPGNGEELHGTVTFSATASDAQTGVTKVEFYVDGVLKGTDTTAPYSIDLDTTQLTDAAHVLTVKAYDGAFDGSNVTTSAAVNVTVNQVVICHTDEADGTATDHYVAGRIDVTAYTTYGAKYGYTTVFMMYHLDSTHGNAWVDIDGVPAGCYTEGGGNGGGETPTVAISSPAGGSIVAKNSSVSVSGTSANAVKVTVQLKGASTGTIYETKELTSGLASWSTSLSTSVTWSGGYKIVATAENSDGSTVTEEISITIQ